jgi:probable rRNA maturation factor
MKSTVRFYVEDVDFKMSRQKEVVEWLHAVAAQHKAKIHELNYILVSDAYLLKLNQNYLQHDTLTDIITFPYEEDVHDDLGGDIYISIERVRENADEYSVPFETELNRVMVHGLLHLIGFEDKGEKAVKAMRAAEDAALAMRQA